MPTLRKADDRFRTRFTVIDGGSGSFSGVIDEPGQGQVPAYQFTTPRRLLRVDPAVAIRPAMVIRSEGGTVFMIGTHGDSELADGVFRSFRLFEATGQFPWRRRLQTLDAVTGFVKDTGELHLLQMVWGAYEPSPEMFDRQMRTSFETARLITTHPVERDDMIGENKVTRSDRQLGLTLLTLG